MTEVEQMLKDASSYEWRSIDKLILVYLEQQAKLDECKKNHSEIGQYSNGKERDLEARIAALEGVLKKIIDWFHPSTMQEGHTAWFVIKEAKEVLYK